MGVSVALGLKARKEMKKEEVLKPYRTEREVGSQWKSSKWGGGGEQRAQRNGNQKYILSESAIMKLHCVC